MDANRLEYITGLLLKIGFSLDKEQLHIGGERFLMAKEKLVLVGRQVSSNLKVVIKISNIEKGKIDITDEKRARDLLKSTTFAKGSLIFPDEIYFGEHDGYIVWIIEYINQEKVFVAYEIEDQFFMALNAFEAQEAFHATTYEHIKKIQKIFPVLNAREYFREFALSKQIFHENNPDSKIESTFDIADAFLKENKVVIDKYSNHLTHTDFVPHNFRIKNNKLYMLDCAPEYRTMHFGNKYEGWARFLNYMVIHNPTLDQLLSQYIMQNRSEEDYLCLRLMRVYKIGFLLRYYAESLPKTSGDLYSLTKSRITFWHQILELTLNNAPIPDSLIEEYKNGRDALRSPEEKERQKEFSIV